MHPHIRVTKNTLDLALEGTILCLHRNKPGNDQIQQWVPVFHGLLITPISCQLLQGNLCTNTHLVPQWRDLIHFPQGTAVGLSSAIILTHINRTKEHTLNVKKEKILSQKTKSPAQARWAFYLLVRKYPRPKVHSSVAK